MSFAHPNFLWAFAVLLIPILVHLFNFRRYKTIYFSSLQFLKKVDKETNATKTIKHYLILALRLLAFICLVLAFAQPYIPSSANSKSDKNILAVYLDNSFSMSAKGTNGDLLNHAKETLRKTVEQQVKSQQYILVTNELGGIEHRVLSASELLDRIETINLSPTSRPLLQPLRSMRNFLTNEGYNGNIQFLTLSDMQRNNELQTKELDTSASFNFLSFSPQNTQNLFIDSVWFEEPFQRKGLNSKLNIRVVNFSNADLTNVEIQLTLGTIKRQALVDIDAKQKEIVSINFTNKDSGMQSGKVTVTDDQLYFDNTFYFSFSVEESLNITIINEGKSSGFVEKVFKTDDFYNINNLGSDRLKNGDFSSADLIVLNGLNTIPSGLRTKLNQLSKQGKSICVIPGSSPDKNTYNQLLKSFGLPIINTEINQALRINEIATDYAFFDGIFDKKVDNIRMPPLQKHFSSSIYTAVNYLPLIKLENNDPIFVSTSGRQKTYMFYSSADKDFNDFSQSALFSALLLKIGKLSQTKQDLFLTLGTAQNYTTKIEMSQDEKVELLNGEVRFIPEMSYSDGILDISIEKTSENQSVVAGEYTMLYKNDPVGNVALNYNREESKLEYYSEKEISNYLNMLNVTKTNFQRLDDFDDIQQLSIENSNEYWRILLTLSLVFLIVEMLVVTRWKR